MSIAVEPFLISSFETDLGFMALAIRSHGTLVRIWFDYPNESALRSAIKQRIDELGEGAASVEFDDRHPQPLIRRFRAFARGTRDDFSDLSIETNWMTPFQRRVIHQARKIAYGGTMSYGELARRSGSPAAARAVGSVMAQNRFPLVVPCHRVVAGGRRLGGFSSVRGQATKRRLLQLEGSLNKKGALID